MDQPLLEPASPATVAATALTTAVKALDLDTIAAILEHDPSIVNNADAHKKTALTTLCCLEPTVAASLVGQAVDMLLVRGASVNFADGHGDSPLSLATRKAHIALLSRFLAAAKTEGARIDYSALLVAALEPVVRPAQVLGQGRSKLDLSQILEAQQAADDEREPCVKAILKAFELDPAAPLELWKARTASGLSALHLAARALLPATTALLLLHSFPPSLSVRQAGTSVHVLEHTILQLHARLAPRGRRRSAPDALPYATQKVLAAPAVRILSAFGDAVGYAKLFQDSGACAVRSRWLKTMLVAAVGFEAIYRKMTHEPARLIAPFLALVGGLYRDAPQAGSAAWIDAQAGQHCLLPSPELRAHLASLLLHVDTALHVGPAWGHILVAMDAVDAPWLASTFLRDLAGCVAHSATCLLFNLQTDAYEYDDDGLVNVALARLQLLLVLGRDAADLRDVLAPLLALQPLVAGAMPAIRHLQDAPERVLLALLVVQLARQVINADRKAVCEALAKAPRSPSKGTHNVFALAKVLPLPATFVEWLAPHRSALNVLLQSEPTLLGKYLHRDALPLVDLEVKAAYFGATAAERGTDLRLQVNRQAPAALLVEFVVEQVASAAPKECLGEMDVSFLHEPGAGDGPLREFFELVRRYFFDPTAKLDDATSELPPTATARIGQLWLQHARTVASSKAAAGPPLSAFFPLVDQRDNELVLAPHTLASAPTVVDGVPHVRFEELVASSHDRRLFMCLGRLLGLAVRHGMVLGARFPAAFWPLLRGEAVPWSALCGSNAVLRRSLEALLATDVDAAPGELVFETCARVQWSGAMVAAQVELQPNGFATPVTNQNKAAFVRLLAERHACGCPVALAAVRKGFYHVLPPTELAVLRSTELASLVAGPEIIDLAQLQASVAYGRLASPKHPTIVAFWAVVHGLLPGDVEKLLLFWSGSGRPPPFGFAPEHADQVAWSIDVEPFSGHDQQAPLPRAQTCDRKLVLPAYPTAEVLATKLLIALELGALGYDRI
ncbi:Hect domain-containing protein [Achlya hypogyna]|uniref:HECT-type E3 ubiquitin transferase n=1 Tax=Achlya hypogyna TaxID=1202772 RepID=A0A1V9ZEA6_ACHHY|nr:Hect domain-containing protein [Achlya hypogyna]